MKLSIITLFAIIGNFAIDAVPRTTESQSIDWNLYLPKLQNTAQLVQAMKKDLNSANIDGKLNDETGRINDYSETYSSKVQQLVSGIRPLILTAHDGVYNAISTLHGWCSMADVLLDAFLDTFPSNDIESRAELLKDLFASDATAELMDKLKKTSDALHSATSLVSNISAAFDSDFNVQSPLFKKLLRHEILNDENKHFDARLIEKVLQEMQKYIDHPELLPHIKPRNLAGAVLSPVRPDDTEGEPSTAPPPPEETPVTPQIYIRFRDLVWNRFESTKKFFIAYKNSVDRAISSVDEIKAKIAGNNQSGAGSGNVPPQSPPNGQPATDGKLKNAAKALKNNCKQFSNAQS